MIELGRRYRDIATGVEGMATARLEQMTGPVSFNLEWRDANGIPKNMYVATERLEAAREEATPSVGFGG